MITTELTFAEYRAIAGINASAIKKGRTSMLHMHHEMTKAETPSTPAQRRGTLIHLRTLEPDRFNEDVVVYDGTKRGKKWDEFKENNEGKEVLTPLEVTYYNLIYDKIMEHPEARMLIEESQHEVSMQWEGTYGMGKARADMVSDFIADLKSTGTVDPVKLQKHTFNQGWHIQMGWITEGLETLGRQDMTSYIIAVEQEAPHDVAVFEMDDDYVKMGQDEAHKLAVKYRACELDGKFQGCVDGIQTLSAPEYAKEKKDDWVL